MRARLPRLQIFIWRALSWEAAPLTVAGLVFVASTYALARGVHWVVVATCALLAYTFGLILWRGVLTANAERQISSRRRLQLGQIRGPVRIPPGPGYVASTILVTNARRESPATYHNLRANLIFKNMDEERRVAGMFVATDRQSITSEPIDSVSLDVACSTSLVVFVTDLLNRNFTTFSTWPFDPSSEIHLDFGEWRLDIVITGDDEDTTSASYILQLSPDLSSGWRPVQTVW